jgi:hypothetical protein
VNLLDSLALKGRRYEQVILPRTGERIFRLADVLAMFDRHAILELTPFVKGGRGATKRPDDVRKIKVSLLDDGISAIQQGSSDWYEVYRTPPSGDLSWVRIVARAPSSEEVGELRMLVGRRVYSHYFDEDPILREIARHDS